MYDRDVLYCNYQQTFLAVSIEFAVTDYDQSSDLLFTSHT